MKALTERRIGVERQAIAVAVVRYDYVPVIVELLDRAPADAVPDGVGPRCRGRYRGAADTLAELIISGSLVSVDIVRPVSDGSEASVSGRSVRQPSGAGTGA